MKLALGACAFALAMSTFVRFAEAQPPWPQPLPPPSTPASDPIVAQPPSQVAPPNPAQQPTALPPPAQQSSVRMTLEATQQMDRPPPPQPKAERSPDDYSLLHGFRLGYGYVMNYDEPAESFGGKSLKEQAHLRSPHHFLLGYEV